MTVSINLSGAIDVLQDRILALRATTPSHRRIIVALTGVPGAGKSTIAAGLLVQLQHAGVRDVTIVPMVSWTRT